MAVVILNKKELKKILGNLSDDKINDKLSLFGVGVEKQNETNVEVEVTPNRPDMLSQQGLFRALNSYFKNKVKKYKVKKSGHKVKVKSLKQWPYVVTAIVKNLSFDNEKIKEIIDIQEKLSSTLLRNRKKGGIGVYPLDKIHPPISFTPENPDKIKFRPLEYPQEITGKQILSKHPTGREYAHICQDWEQFPIFKDSKGTIMSMPPIINSHEVGKIDETTKDVFIEATGTDLNILQKALNIIVTTLADVGGEIYSMELDYGNKKIITPDLAPEKMKLNINNANKLLGLSLKEQEIKKLLEKMSLIYNKGIVEIPAYRVDIMHEVDLIEDIAIAYGYDKFIPEIPPIATIAQEDYKQSLKEKIIDILIGLGFLELSSLHLVTKDDIKKYNIKEIIEVEDSKSDYRILRKNLLINSLKILSENVDSEYPQKVFEIGSVFKTDKNQETGIKEADNLVVSLIPGNFTEIKQILEYLGKMINISFKIKSCEDSRFIEGRVGKIIAEKNINKENKESRENKENKEIEVGIIGEIHPQILKSNHLKFPVSCFEVCLDEIF